MCIVQQTCSFLSKHQPVALQLQTKMASLLNIESHRSPSVGFDCKFIEKPPKEFQSECPVCLLLLREPHTVSCCGYSFCHACIHRIKTSSGSCPCCNEDNFDFFLNKGLKRSLYEFKIYCSNQIDGCQWTGNLGQLDSHLNCNPQKLRSLEGCQYVYIKCSYCSKSFLRSKINNHKQYECLMRPYVCPHCNRFESTYGEVTISHWTECGLFPTPCECGETLQRQFIDDHIANVCPKTIVECDFKHFGCDVRLSRKDMKIHIGENLASHIGKLARLVVRLEAENKHLMQELECLQISTPRKALNLIMNNLDRHMRKGTPWNSPSFYVQGYKLHLQVYVNDHDENGSLCTTIFVCLMQGEFDESLKWPFKAVVCVELLKEENARYVVLYSARIAHEGQRVTTKNVPFGRGVTAVHSGLMQHVRHDCLYFRIPAVQLSI